METAFKDLGFTETFFLGGDIPSPHPALIKEIFNVAGRKRYYQAVVPILRNRPQPLFAYFSIASLNAIQRCLDDRKFAVTRMLRHLTRVRYLDERFLRTYDPHLESFFNLNTKKDLDNLLSGRNIPRL